jgi:hypothetical protein
MAHQVYSGALRLHPWRLLPPLATLAQASCCQACASPERTYVRKYVSENWAGWGQLDVLRIRECGQRAALVY